MRQKDILLMLGSLCILAIAWVIFTVYHSTVTSTIPETVVIKVNPIVPDFDTKSITAIKQRKKITPVFIFSTTPAPTPSAAVRTKFFEIATQSSLLR